MITACGGNIAQPKSITPSQKLKTAENNLTQVGISFDSSNQIVSCSSLHLATCNSRIASLDDYINSAFDLYGSEVQMPADIQVKIKNSVTCEDQIKSDIKNDSATNCHH